ncbi:MAG: ABC transporter substrate-binding protein [Lachnospiraceae bacterium]|nr:ABC transporter substrate-binding protein [Lachnospiraceae bacterium]
MKKKTLGLMAAAVALFAFAAGCTDAGQGTVQEAPQETAEETTEETTEENTESQAEGQIRVGSLKGPTTMGLVNLMKDCENGDALGNYSFTMETDASVLMASMISGDIDIALVPANMASIMYNKTEGQVSVIDINTLGVLECVTGNPDVASIEDLAGQTIVTTGQGTTPEYVLEYLLSEYNVEGYTLDFKSEATEVAAALQADSNTVAVLPQPFATVACAQNEGVASVFALTDAWDGLDNGSKLLTGVTVVRNDYLNNNTEAVELFLSEHKASAEAAVSDVEGTSELIAEYGIIEKAPVAAKALPKCNIVCITGDDMKAYLSGYLQVLYEADPASVGGALPEDSFYAE